MKRISNIQLFTLIMIFEIGSTTLFALGIGAKQDAWIVIITASLVGFFLLWVYTQISKIYPNKNFHEILNEALGKKLATPLLLLFGLYFLSGASFNFYEFGHLIKITALPNTPLIVILYIFIIASIYILNLGFKVFARTSEILLPIFLIFLITVFFITLYSGHFDFTHLQPVLGSGFSPILQELRQVIGFPYGEMVVFLMYWHYVDKQNFIQKTSFLALFLSTFLITLTSIIMISVLGPEYAGNTEIPLLETILSINIGDILINLDMIAVLIMFIGGFFKMTLHFYGFTLSITWLLNAKSPKWIMTISGLLFPLYAIFRFPGFDHHRWKGVIYHPYVMLVMSFIPVMLLIIIFLKKKKSSFKKGEKHDNHSANTKG